MKLPIAAAAAVILTLGSCAKREIEDTRVLEQRSLDAWMNANKVGKEGIELARQSNGVWVEFIAEGDPETLAVADTAVWVNLDYTSTDIAGNVYNTRDSVEALRQRTYSPHTYYVPEFVYCGTSNTGLGEGLYSALRDKLTRPDGSTTQLREGSHVRLYIPSYLTSGAFSDNQGYGGQFALGRGKIAIQDVKLGKVIKNPLQYEEERVEQFATTRWGKAVADTLAPGFYIDTINFHPRADLLERFPQREFKKEYALTADSTARVWYIGRLLPSPEYPRGFIFDTNIASVYEEFFGRRRNENYPANEKTAAVMSYNPTANREKDIAGWFRAVPELRRGQWSRIVFTSSYGYGVIGMSASVKLRQKQMAQMAQMFSYSRMYGGMYGGYGGGYDYGYGGGYYPSMNMYDNVSAEDIGLVTTIQPYTPLIFEIYIETLDQNE